MKTKLKFYWESVFKVNLKSNENCFFFGRKNYLIYFLIVFGSALLLGFLISETLIVEAYSFNFDKFKVEIAAIREAIVLPDGSLKKDCVPYEDFVNWYREVKFVYIKAESRIIADRGFYEPELKGKVADLLLIIKWIELDGITNHESGIRAVCTYKSEMFKVLFTEIKQGFNFK